MKKDTKVWKPTKAEYKRRKKAAKIGDRTPLGGCERCQCPTSKNPDCSSYKFQHKDYYWLCLYCHWTREDRVDPEAENDQ